MQLAVRALEVGRDPGRRAVGRRRRARPHHAREIAVDGEPPPGAPRAARGAAVRPPAVEVEDRARIGRPPGDHRVGRPGKDPRAVGRDQRLGIQRPAECDESRIVVRIHDAQFTRRISPRTPSGARAVVSVFRLLWATRPSSCLRSRTRTPRSSLVSRSRCCLTHGSAVRLLARAPAPAADHAALAAGLARLVRVELVRRAFLMSRLAALRRDLALPLRIHPREPPPATFPLLVRARHDDFLSSRRDVLPRDESCARSRRPDRGSRGVFMLLGSLPGRARPRPVRAAGRCGRPGRERRGP